MSERITTIITFDWKDRLRLLFHGRVRIVHSLQEPEVHILATTTTVGPLFRWPWHRRKGWVHAGELTAMPPRMTFPVSNETSNLPKG